MSSNPSAPAPGSLARPPLRIILTILHLGAIGTLGWIIVSAIFGLLGVGLGTIIILGIGAIFLVGLVYMLFGVAWFEFERVSGLYDLNLPALRLVVARGPGFGEYLRQIGRQSIDGGMWRGVGSFLITTVLGTMVVGFLQAAVSSLLLAIYALMGSANADSSVTWFGFFPDVQGGSIWLGILAAVLSAAAIVGIALLHRLITVGIARAGAREQALTTVAATSARQREGAVRAADVERTRIERDLHDGVQPRLVSVGMTLGLAQQQIDSDPEAAKALITEAHTSTKAAITELRQLARGIHASVLDDRGLDAALSALASRSHVPVILDVRLSGRCSREAETAMYFSIAETLTNAAKHSRGTECRVVVRLREGNTLWARIEDNGIGGARVLPGGGLDGISNRVAAAGGTFTLDSPQGGPTAVEVSIPCAS